MASKYQDRLHKEAPDVLKVVIPNVCHGFDKMLILEEFSRNSKKAATQAVKDGFKTLVFFKATFTCLSYLDFC